MRDLEDAFAAGKIRPFASVTAGGESWDLTMLEERITGRGLVYCLSLSNPAGGAGGSSCGRVDSIRPQGAGHDDELRPGLSIYGSSPSAERLLVGFVDSGARSTWTPSTDLDPQAAQANPKLIVPNTPIRIVPRQVSTPYGPRWLVVQACRVPGEP